ncbi:protein dachsous-like [Antedon mediterranea]|uniref:protein dachsous-like n=1 Tax=Antedon mediterranea TaxID=105859 RepID=UPI003AF52546
MMKRNQTFLCTQQKPNFSKMSSMICCHHPLKFFFNRKSSIIFYFLAILIARTNSQQDVTFEIEEGQPANTVIGALGNPPYANGFDISNCQSYISFEETDGTFKTNAVLDRETIASCTFIVFNDFGNNIQVLINIKDVNDNAPIFLSPSSVLNLSESTPLTRLNIDYATDADSSAEYTVQRYEILSGNDEGTFNLSSKSLPNEDTLILDLELVAELDRERVPQYTLVIAAYDGGDPVLSGTTTLTINVEDVNDNAPMFLLTSYSATVNESTPVNTKILSVTAMDLDEGLNGQIVYEINRRQSDTDEIFRIDPVTGDLYLNKPLDYETQATHEIIVVAKDSSPEQLENTAFVTITVTNINEGAPTIYILFFGENGEPKISEDAEPGDYIGRVSVNDPDEAELTNVSVTLSGGDGNFGVETQDSIIYLVCVKRILDREEVASYNLTIFANDYGIPPLNAQKNFILEILDVNDNPPVFDPSQYDPNIQEVADPGTFVTQVQATDADAGINAQITYSITTGPQSNWFHIDPNSGLVTTDTEIDREVAPVVNLTVVATDMGTPSMSSSVLVHVTIRDVNDNQPQFDPSSYSHNVLESVNVGTCLFEVVAIDPDAEGNGHIQYSLSFNYGTPPPPEFMVEATSGKICTTMALDYDVMPRTYSFFVQATDDGGLSSVASVDISLIDVNDNEPVFYPQYYSENKSESTMPDTNLVTVFANDMDSGDFAKITFTIVGGNDLGLFSIDGDTGILKLIGTLDRQQRALHRLEVQATDSGGLTSVENAIISISVLGLHDSIPVFDNAHYEFSIIESADLEDSVGTVHAMNQDPGNQDVITYSISSGDPNSYFTINPSTGEITVNTLLDFESDERVTLLVKASSGSPPSYDESFVLITIEDVNDYTPRFASNTVQISLSESTPVDSFFFYASANDIEKGSNGEVRYQLTLNPENTFFISEQSGGIKLTKSLDYNVRVSYVLTILAYDLGTPSLSSELSLEVTVIDMNDNGPRFDISPYNVDISEDIAISQPFLQIMATDIDRGSNARITYTIRASDDAAYFSIFPDTGYLYTTSLLDRELKAEYELQVIATDNGVPPQNATAIVYIHVTDVNDNAPIIEGESFYFDVTENMDTNTVVGQINAEDRDEGDNAQLVYSLLQTQKFQIDSNGVITTTKVLDRETTSNYEFTVVVTDRGETPLSSEAVVHVTVNDVNDNAPSFLNTMTYTAEVLEGLDAGALVLRVLASDPDKGSNGAVTYSLISGTRNSLFSINPTTGEVTTTQVLDRETAAQHMISILAQDGGTPPMESTIMVQVQVKDVNDNPPLVENETITLTVMENIQPGTELGRIRASDVDGTHKVTYYIVAGNDYGIFSINRTSGSIINVKVLDFEFMAHHHLTIEVLDDQIQPQSTTAYANINVLDENDNPPVFSSNPIVFGIEENIAIGTVVWTFSATDADSAENGMIRYAIETDQVPFTITENGDLVTISVIDREAYQQSRMTLVVVAEDQPMNPDDRLMSSVTVQIIIEDKNDNSPSFTSRTQTYAMEDEPVGYPVIHVVAVDDDLAESGRVVYQINSGNEDGKFLLDAISGVLSVAEPLDREHKHAYSLIITATDNGLPQLSSTQNLTVYVEDVNDMPPHFEPTSYSMNVSENMSPGTVIGQVTATDGDTGENGRLTYEIPNGIADNMFTVNAETGEVKTTSQLDRETKETYIVTVYVRDNAFPARYDLASVLVNVVDENDHAPMFGVDTYHLDIPENQPSAVVHTVAATDNDGGINGALEYSIIDGNTNSMFSINPVTGQLSTTGALDRETTSQYSLSIQASDGAVPPMTATMVINVTVGDQNDNDPVFVSPFYSESLPEDTPVDTIVDTVRALDADAGDNAAIQYSLDNSTRGLFRIDPDTGVIRTSGTFDFEIRGSYIFEVKATDGGPYGPRTEKVQVTVDITDVNDNAPIFETEPILANMTQDAMQNTYVTTVSAEDKDSGDNGLIKFSIDEENIQYFTIDELTGVITVNSQLSPSVPLYRFEVTATDLGSPSLSNNVVVEVRVGNAAISSLNFDLLEYNANLPEDARVVTPVETVHAEHSDKANNSPIMYSIIRGNDEGAFAIDEMTGAITVAQENILDYETSTYVQLLVQAKSESGGTVPAQGYTKVNINLQDSNDNIPRFGQERYATTVFEGSSENYYVVKVSATDDDSGTNAQITYRFSSANNDDHFNIDPQTGIITTRVRLDREIVELYKLTLEAVDGGNPPNTGSATIKISINDKNDNPPVLPGIPPVSINEGAKVGTVVYNVQANDADKDPTLTYDIIEGNTNSEFQIDRFSGTVTLNAPLDREDKPEYQLTITAFDGVETAKGGMTVIILDENDNAPEFSEQSYEVTIPELTPPGYPIKTVNATDVDEGTNAQIEYSMGVAPVLGFYIDPITGTIFTNQTIDYNPSQPVIQLVITARDHGDPPLSAVVAVRIQVTDVNNNSPDFDTPLYEESVPENSPHGSHVLTVHAEDRDPSHDNNNIYYSILSGNEENVFRIDGNSGEITVNGLLDREQKNLYTLVILATDRGSPQRNSTAEAIIEITDVNDHSPVFQFDAYYANISEAAADDTPVLTVSATDADQDGDEMIRFEIISGNDKDLFKIGTRSGVISVKSGLDHDKGTPEVVLSVQALDDSHPDRRSSEVNVVIDILDENDNKPYFPSLMYIESLEENQPVDTLVFTAKALDEDTGIYGSLTYSIQGGDGQDFFSINSDTGEVRTLASFDYETTSIYRIHILATDSGGEKIGVQAQVDITSIDEYEPQFSELEYQFSVPSDAKQGTSVGTVKATDDDKGKDGVVRYSFENIEEYYVINDTTGVISVRKDMSGSRRRRSTRKRHVREAPQQEAILVKASSGRKDSLEARATVTVVVDIPSSGGNTAAGDISLILAIILPLIFIVLLILVILLILMWKRKNGQQKPSNVYSQGRYSPPAYDANTFDRVDMSHGIMANGALQISPAEIHRIGNLYAMRGANSSMEVGHLTRTDISDQSNSASSGRGSTTVEDEEIRKINEGSKSDHSSNQRGTVIDSGIQHDHEDSSSVLDDHDILQNTKVMNGFLSSKSVESMHVFGEEGGGEAGGGVDIGNIIYAKLDEVGAEEDDAVMDGTRSFGFDDHGQPSMAGSLSSIVNSDEEFSGSYNWDYLLDWGPQFQPLAHVFAEIAKLKDDSVARRQIEQRPPQQKSAFQPKLKTHPPPLITSIAQGPFKPVVPLASNTSSHTRNSSPRSPISHENIFQSLAVSPDLSPSLSPLAPGSPSISPLVTSTGLSSMQTSRCTSGQGTPGRIINPSHYSVRLPPLNSADQKEFQI